MSETKKPTDRDMELADAVACGWDGGDDRCICGLRQAWRIRETA